VARYREMNKWQKAGSGLTASNDRMWVLPEEGIAAARDQNASFGDWPENGGF